MTTREALDFYGGMKRLCYFLDVSPQAIYSWGEYPPRDRQFELQVRSKGELTVEPELLAVQEYKFG